MSLDMSIPVRAPTLADKVAFLSQASTYGLGMREAVVLRETHMSWVFLAGDKVYKLKKPVRFPYLDFSTLAQRETACRAELSLSRRGAACAVTARPLNRRCWSYRRLARRYAPSRRVRHARAYAPRVRELNNRSSTGSCRRSQSSTERRNASLLFRPYKWPNGAAALPLTIASFSNRVSGFPRPSSAGSMQFSGRFSRVVRIFWRNALEVAEFLTAMGICVLNISGSRTGLELSTAWSSIRS